MYIDTGSSRSASPFRGLGAVNPESNPFEALNTVLVQTFTPLRPAIDRIPGLSADKKNKLKHQPINALLEIFQPIEFLVYTTCDEAMKISGKPTFRIPADAVGLDLTSYAKSGLPSVTANVNPNLEAFNKFKPTTRQFLRRMTAINSFMIWYIYHPATFARAFSRALVKYGLCTAGEVGRDLQNKVRFLVGQAAQAKNQFANDSAAIERQVVAVSLRLRNLAQSLGLPSPQDVQRRLQSMAGSAQDEANRIINSLPAPPSPPPNPFLRGYSAVGEPVGGTTGGIMAFGAWTMYGGVSGGRGLAESGATAEGTSRSVGPTATPTIAQALQAMLGMSPGAAEAAQNEESQNGSNKGLNEELKEPSVAPPAENALTDAGGGGGGGETIYPDELPTTEAKTSGTGLLAAGAAAALYLLFS